MLACDRWCVEAGDIDCLGPDMTATHALLVRHATAGVLTSRRVRAGSAAMCELPADGSYADRA
eukprot:NODE_5066_length_615_cov_242.955357.p2 GENE.NODE_5066_length_615_cov_242.955357~~NODE_5066_length_615_cov_242.955357.p2  ORF type:complete len:63 (-),score=2.14 NODE_5066_length_615_cov_242.955357:426-614(-)